MDRQGHGPKVGRNAKEEQEEEKEEEICREEMRKTKTLPAGIVGIPTGI
jgi:hypothetical protein